MPRSLVSAAALSLLAAAAVAVPCLMPTSHPADGTESIPCSACIRSTYTSCPTPDTCPKVFWAGFDACTTSPPVSVPCIDYSTAPPAGVNSAGCCSGGLKIGNSSTKAVITYQIGSGDCW